MDIFNKVKAGFDRSVATVSTGSKVFIEKSKLNNSKKNLEDSIKNLEMLIGAKVCDIISSGVEEIPVSEVIDLYNDAVSRRQQIEVLNAEIIRLDQEMNQVKGEPSVMTPAPVRQGSVVCSCGEINPPGSRFCAGCGSPLNQ